MIITNIIGGLGNQMFQYAAGRAAAYHNKTDLALDIMGFKNTRGIKVMNLVEFLKFTQ